MERLASPVGQWVGTGEATVTLRAEGHGRAIRVEQGCEGSMFSMSQKHRADADPGGEGESLGAGRRGPCPQIAPVPTIGQPCLETH